MNLKVFIEGLLLLAFSLVAMVEGFRLVIYKDPYILYDPLGPGIYILVLALGVMATSVVHFVVNYRRVPSFERVTTSKEMRVQLLSSIGILALYILLVDFVGYLVGTLTFFFLQLRVAGVKSWRTNVILTLMLTALYYLIFVKFCDVVFPKGILF